VCQCHFVQMKWSLSNEKMIPRIDNGNECLLANISLELCVIKTEKKGR
jgi:hypothetical protein